MPCRPHPDLPGPVREDRPEIEGFCFNELAYFPPEQAMQDAAAGAEPESGLITG